MISFDTNILVYATASISDVKVTRARDLIARAMRAASSVLLLQTLAEFSNVALRKAKIPVKDIRRTIDAWRAVLPIQAADDDDLLRALDAGEGTPNGFLGRNVIGFRTPCGRADTCLPKICKMVSSCRASRSSIHSNEKTIN